ncbi:DUF6328 family protein [Streptomyces poonensis]|uniref:Membrane protein n=1 Tax=Streptomyces poonensis TaxID=68255 RepID=A0A918PYU5_9ACTN|nr:DUF6328 family protein [Streptomyces poonensis]GGZ27608.1 membrane protein [Streptomyces poonensis]GLJ89713.1 membrane protein [Streptomyces poonensis]
MAEHRSTHTERNETPLERADRNFIELLQELRVTQTGVQVLFAFLLSMAFTPRFEDLDTFQRVTYVVTLLLALLSALLFVAPAALHRSLFQQNAKPLIVRVSDRLASVGLAVLTLAFTGSVTLVVDVTLEREAGIAAGAGTLLACLGLWGLLPRLVWRSGARSGETDVTPPARDRAAALPPKPREPFR